MTRACSVEIRTISHLLHPPVLDELGLAAAIRWYIEEFATRSGIQVTADVPQEMDRFGNDIELALFRVLQESLTNVHRHSKSQAASVKVSRNPTAVVLEVEDHGRSQISVKSLRPGMGIMGMRERVRDLGGTLEITSQGLGLHVKAVIPLSSATKTISAQTP